MKIETLFCFPGLPFSDTFESFFDKYKLSEDVECYQFIFCPYETGTGISFNDLNKLNFQTRVVIFNIIDSIIDIDDNMDIRGLRKFCAKHPENSFIISSPHLNLQRELDKRGINIPNLYLTSWIPTTFSERVKRCEKGEISNRWLSFNSSTKLHRVMAISYLLSKDYGDNGDFTFDFRHKIYKQPYQYKNFKPPSPELKTSFAKGHEKFKNKEFNRIKISQFDSSNLAPAANYNNVLSPVYSTYGIEIITGTSFFEQTPLLSEKEIQSVWGMTFPIFLNGVGMVRELKSLFDLDLFDGVIDHSYDEIEDHFERMAAAIDRNQHLLDGSTDIHKLWTTNKHRFESNFDKIESVLYDRTYQTLFNHNKIKQSLHHFNISLGL
jgi:hypothetical protein